MCVWGGGGKGERNKEGERERTSGLSQSVRGIFFFLSLILCHAVGLALRRRNGTEKNTFLLLLLRIKRDLLR